MKQTLTKQIDNWTTRLVLYPGDPVELLARKKVYLLGVVSVLVMVMFLTLLTWQLQLPILTRYGLALLVYFSISFTLQLILKKGLAWFIFANCSYSILLTFGVILQLGGIPNSGGLIFVGLVSVIYAMIYPSSRLLIWCFSLYVITLILEGLLHSYLTPPVEMTPDKNLLLFVLNSLWLSGTILLVILYVFAKETQIAKLKADRLLEMDQLKSRMFTNISHEFRTPLTLISGMAELIRENPNQKLQERSDVILRNANRVLRLVDQMLNLSRIEADAMPLQPVQSNIISFLRYVAGSFKGLSEHRKVKLHFLPDQPELVIDFDPEKLEELVGNLLSNALKYTLAGGDVYFSIHTTYLPKTESTIPEEQLLIKVRDTGIGIPPEDLSHIFERFYRVENAKTHYEEGSGIGLTLVREYVKLMHGSIEVQSKPGTGSEFTITLPITRNAPIQEPAFSADPMDELAPTPELEWPAMQEADNHLPQLLIIEDNPDVVQYLRLVLEDKFHLRIAHNGEEGIRDALEHIPDLILSDVMMPVKDGYEVCRTLKKDFRTSHIPIVLLTARADTTSRITGLELGADAYLTKPFHKKELIVCLRNLFVQREKLRIKYGASNHEPLEPTHTAGPDEQFIQNARSILEKNYADEHFGIDELYQALGISRVQLHRKLIALTGQSSSHYIRSFRLEKARQMLTDPNKTISEIAYQTGFSDANYFSRVFALEFGQPPSNLRNVNAPGA